MSDLVKNARIVNDGKKESVKSGQILKNAKNQNVMSGQISKNTKNQDAKTAKIPNSSKSPKLRAPRLTRPLLEKIFTAASIRRWNDQATPVEFSELDKQAHKMLIAYLLAKYEESRSQVDYEKLIQQFLFEFFERIVLTDIKPPVFHRLAKTHNKELANFACEALCADLGEYEFFAQMKPYLLARNNAKKPLEAQMLRAAHYYASKWEFDLIYNFAPKLPGVGGIKRQLDAEVAEHHGLLGINAIMREKKSEELVSMFGQLRFQKRWSRTPRVPETSVLGHTLIVAISAYLLSFDLGCCPKMRVNHFLCGLFHDLPEILTRDIISPIKHEVAGIDALVKDIERREVDEKIISKVPENMKKDIIYFTRDEFANRFVRGGETKLIDADGLREFNRDEFNPVFGEFLKVCDQLGAFLEAKISIAHGISSNELVSGSEGIYERRANQILWDLDLGALFRVWKDNVGFGG